MILKLIKTVNAHLQTNFKVPHPTLVAIGISAAISAAVIGIFYMADTGMFGTDDALAAKMKGRGRHSDI